MHLKLKCMIRTQVQMNIFIQKLKEANKLTNSRLFAGLLFF
jgi:hypothetical protein